jgi:segregation and condensation protein A
MQIKLEKFEGPLSLLLKLIDKEEMDITQVSLAKIAGQYVEYIQTAENIGPEEMADFLVVAARLLLVKSKALLPYLYPEEEEEAEELERQLKMYQEFLEAVKKIEVKLGKKRFMFAREFNRKAVMQGTSFAPPKKLKSGDLSSVMRDILARLQPPEKLDEDTIEDQVNIEEKVAYIQKMLLERIEVSFQRLFHHSASKTEVIVSFLAMLELVKQRDIQASQTGLFEEILISRG